VCVCVCVCFLSVCVCVFEYLCGVCVCERERERKRERESTQPKYLNLFLSALTHIIFAFKLTESIKGREVAAEAAISTLNVAPSKQPRSQSHRHFSSPLTLRQNKHLCLVLDSLFDILILQLRLWCT